MTWADVAATAFGAPRKAQPEAIVAAEIDEFDEFEAIDENAAELSGAAAEHDAMLRQRARTLMTDLREVVERLAGESSAASEEIVGDLEISLTRPSALDGEALSDLRAAAESAQARPRDLDTLTALTAQADTILALIVAYERSSAGIERAIAGIRRQ